MLLLFRPSPHSLRCRREQSIGQAIGPQADHGEGRRMATTDRLKADIDSGRLGDKIAFPDPSAAPLGTDDEAAGSPPTPERVAEAREGELRSAREIGPSAGEERSRRIDGEADGLPRTGLAPILISLVVGLMIAAAVVVLLTAR